MKIKLALISILLVSASSIYGMWIGDTWSRWKMPQLKLLHGARKGNIELVEEALKEGADVNKKDASGSTTLMIAVYRGNIELVEKLIKAGANVNLKDRNGNTALIIAAYKGYNEIAKQLIKTGTNVNLRDIDGWTALMYAADEGNIEIVKQLLSAGADIFIRNKKGKTAIDIAIGNDDNDDNEILKILNDRLVEKQKKEIEKYLPLLPELQQLTAEYLGYPEKAVKKEKCEDL